MNKGQERPVSTTGRQCPVKTHKNIIYMIASIKLPMLTKLLTLTLMTMLCVAPGLSARKLTHKSGKVEFKLHAPMGDIHAVNDDIAGFINTEDGRLSYQGNVFSIRIVTEPAPGQINKATTDRFQNYYLETEQYPDAFFDGRILNLKEVSFTKDGKYPVHVRGHITIHGERKEIAEWSVLEVRGKQLVFKTDFVLTLSDYNIRVPEFVKHIFFKEVAVAVECHLH